MTIAEALTTVRYVLDANGEKSEVLIPLAAWKTILATWEQMAELLEDREDSVILREWLEERAAGEAKMMPLDVLEQELVADGLLPG